MQEFLDSLKKGEFRIPVCTLCKSTAWPPSSYCPKCLHGTMLQDVETIGILLEFAQSYVKGKEGVFGLVEISGIKIMGSLDPIQLKEGIKVKMSKCGLRSDGTAFYHFTKA